MSNKNKKNSEFTQENVINITDVVNQASKYDEISDYTLSNDETMQFYPYFSRTKITEIIEEFQVYTQSENKEDKKIMESITSGETHIILFWYFLMIKKFTHFGVQMEKAKSLSELVNYYNALLETGLLEEIVNDVFLFDEVKKVNNMFANSTALMTSTVEFLNTYEDKLENARKKFKENLKEGNFDGKE
ncbi:TPA: hypothetical protein LQO40_001947 [Staphylococcus pseudintermedius]|nr:hypothetical protein [Staphylococcus pseudintermedius]